MKFAVCLTVAFGLALLDAASAQQPVESTAKVAPAKTPKLDAEALRIPDTIHDTRAKPIAKSSKAAPAPNLPNKFDLGAYDLEFKASHSKDVNPRTGFDSGEKANLSNSTQGRRNDPALPDYFGLKLSAPTR
jgi:hypothetical protein